MLQSIIVYGSMIFSLSLLGGISMFKYKRSKKISFFSFETLLALLIFSFFSGVRYDVGVDHLSYLFNYQLALNGYQSNNYTESLFNWLTIFCAKNGIDAVIYFALLAFIQIFFVYYAFKNEPYLYPFLFFCIITNGTYFMWMNGIRQSIVLCIFIYAVKYIKEKNLIKYLFWVIIGYFIHKSALLLIPLYFIFVFDKDFFINIWIQLALIIIALILSYKDILSNIVPYIEQAVNFLDYSQYENVEYQLSLRQNEYNRSVRFYFPLLINIIIVLFSKKLKANFVNSKFNIYYNIYFIGVLGSLLFYNNPLMQRPILYFIFSGFIIASYLLFFLWENLRTHKLYLPMFIFLIVLHLSILYAYIASDFHTNYNFIWDKI
jgi:hypothetical protein